MKKIIIICLSFFTIQSCAQTKQKTNKMIDHLADKILKQAKQFKERPIYGLHFSKTGCRVAIEVNNSIIQNFF